MYNKQKPLSSCEIFARFTVDGWLPVYESYRVCHHEERSAKRYALNVTLRADDSETISKAKRRDGVGGPRIDADSISLKK